MKKKNHSGKKIGRLSILKYTHNIGQHQYYDVVCDCGKKRNVAYESMRSGSTLSCGCLKKELVSIRFKTHGMTNSKEYKIWNSMVQRCVNKKSSSYANYGANGISVSSRWMDFNNFIADMGLRPTDRHTIERIDNSLGYSMGNCRWATYGEQSRNRSSNRIIAHNGKVKCVSDWAEELGVSENVLNGRLRRGWEIEDALNTPVSIYNKKRRRKS